MDERVRMHPADRITLVLLAGATTVSAIGVLGGADVVGLLGLHAALLAGYAALVAWMRARPGRDGRPVVRGVAVILVMGVLYSTLGALAFRAIPWRADATLAAIDRVLGGGLEPAALARAWATPRAVEALAFVYAAYIPFLYFSIFLGLIGRSGRDREEFVSAFALLYALAYAGYVLLPARGPIAELAPLFDEGGGRFVELVRTTIDGAGGPHGAFPSLHVGASFLVAWYELRHGNALRALIYLPMVALIGVATLVLGYHWLIDVIAGIGLALASARAARLAFEPDAAAVAEAGA